MDGLGVYYAKWNNCKQKTILNDTTWLWNTEQKKLVNKTEKQQTHRNIEEKLVVASEERKGGGTIKVGGQKVQTINILYKISYRDNKAAWVNKGT